MILPLLAVTFLALLAGGYFLYGGWVARQFGVDDRHPTPAHTREDGVDFVPTPPFYLFGQHFSAIAAAGPIAGPILACKAFGWAPSLLWIALGVVLIGAVHDFSSLAASVRRGGSSIAEIAGMTLGKRGGLAMMAFIWIALIYVIVAFTDITAGSFVGKTEELEGLEVAFNPGGAVAMAALLYLGLSVLLGLVERFLKPPLWLSTAIFVPLVFLAVWAGTQLSTVLILDVKTWGLLILGYCVLASVTPVWALLQPRGYLGGFILYFALALGVIGIFFGGYGIEQEAFKGASAGTIPGTSAANTMMPFLFVTIACGACSGFHGLVCSGTTSKQVSRERHLHPVGYGAMLAEAFVAFIALVTIMKVADADLVGLKPGTIYGNGIGDFLTLVIGEGNRNFAITFGAMAFSTFVFDTLDVSTRLGRYLLQELTGMTSRVGAMLGTLATILPAVVFVYGSTEGSFFKFWTLFGASNQLLAALTLLSITVWLYQARRRIAFTLLPMLFVLGITLHALVVLTIGNLVPAPGKSLDWVNVANAVSSIVLIGLAIYLVGCALVKVRGERVGESAMLPAGTPLAGSDASARQN